MSIHDIFALVIGSFTLSTAVMVVLSRNAIHATLFLLLTMVGVGCEFAILNAHFLAAVQILLYSGTVVALILFVFMMLGYGNNQEQGLSLPPLAIIVSFLLGGTLVAAGGIGIVRGKALKVPHIKVAKSEGIQKKGNEVQGKAMPKKASFGSIGAVGRLLVTDMVLAFEVLCVLLLLAVVGVVCLFQSEKKDPKKLVFEKGDNHAVS